MKNLKLPFVAMIVWMALPGFGAAIETISESFVGSAVTIPGVQGAGERVSLFSLRAVRPALYAGKVSSVTSTSIGDNGANWTTGLFAGRGAMYAEFANGLEADIQQVNVAARTISFSGALPGSLTVGTAYRIREHHTVAEVFGNANQAGLLSGANTAEAETILQYIPEAQPQELRTYFFLNFSGITGWVRDDYSAASNIVLYPEQGLMVRRLRNSDLTFTSSGPLKQTASTIPVYPGYNFLGVYNRAVPARLDSLNLLAAGFLGGANADAGDNIYKYASDSATPTRYFYLNLTGFEGWYDDNYQPAGQVTLSPGSVFLLYHLPTAQPLQWTLPSQ